MAIETRLPGYTSVLPKFHSTKHLSSVCMPWRAVKFGTPYKEKDGDIIQRYDDGHERIRFKPTPAHETVVAMGKLVKIWKQCLQERWVPPAVAMAAFNLDFLCIHPFRDGNGRVSRLVLLLQTYHAGMEVGRYRLIEQNKDRYYETLEQCSYGWHDSRHDPWPFINYILNILKNAYQEFEERVGQVAEPKGAKAELVRNVVRRYRGEFRLSDIERACPGVGREWIRNVLADMKKTGELKCTGRGVAARWSVCAKEI